ncbi:MAG: GldG family protein [Deltaproteobacteria bacterium]|nr:GldG family protein [Deltaproteobacteria bacterium]
MGKSSGRSGFRAVNKAAGLLGALSGAAALFFAAYYPDRRAALWVLASVSVAALTFFFVAERRCLARLPRSRAARYGANSAAMVLAFAGILFLLNFLAGRHNNKWDVTAGRLHTLSLESRKVLQGLKKDVVLTAFFAEGTPPQQEMKRLLESYKAESSHLKVTFVDPDRSPELARQYGVKEFGTTVLASGEHTYRLGEASEEAVTNAIVRGTRESKKTLCFLSGHGERGLGDTQRGGYSTAKKALEDQGYAVRELLLFREADVPNECDELVIAGPTKPILEAELGPLRAFLNRGGKLLLFLDPGLKTGLEPLLAEWGVVLHDDVIIDTMSRLFGGSYTTPILTEYPSPDITRDFKLATFLSLARSLAKAEPLPKGITFAPVARTSPQSWGETDLKEDKAAFDVAKDYRGPLTVAGLFERTEAGPFAKPGAQLLVVGDSDFADNTYFAFSGNGDLFLNMVSYLTKEQDLISVRPKDTKSTPLVLSRAQAATLFYTTVVLGPLSLMLIGLTIWLKRRRL